MKPASSRDLLQRLVRETDESAAVSLLVDLCRASPALRLWLFEDFAKSEDQRREFAARLKESGPSPTRFADLDGQGAASRHELRALRDRFAQRTFGGLTFSAVTELIVRYQAGPSDAAAFLLALEWHRQAKPDALPPRLIRAASDFLSAALAPGGANLLRDLARAAELVTEFSSPRRLRAALGFTDWWRLSTLLYILRHPAPAYRTRDLLEHLRAQRLAVSSRALRQFCTEHGIARDMRPGRPAPSRAPDGRPQRGPAPHTSHPPPAAGIPHQSSTAPHNQRPPRRRQAGERSGACPPVISSGRKRR